MLIVLNEHANIKYEYSIFFFKAALKMIIFATICPSTRFTAIQVETVEAHSQTVTKRAHGFILDKRLKYFVLNIYEAKLLDGIC